MPRKTKDNPSGRDVQYPEVVANLCTGDEAITVEQAKELIGWFEEPEGDDKASKFGDDYWLQDLHGNKIRCTANVTKGYTNRPLIMGNVLNLRQEILHGRWQFNGEPIIVGKTGLILNGQHTLIALITAAQAYANDPEAYPAWDEEPKIDKLVVTGVDETDEIVNTMDTGKPRSLADVIYRSSHFANVDKASNRKKLAKVLEHAVGFLWKRTGAGNTTGVRRTHSEALDFIERHPKLLECAAFVFSENEGKNLKSGETETNRISRYISLGYFTALMYLMGSSKSSWEDYLTNPSEESVDWSMWDKACSFCIALANANKDVSGVLKGTQTEQWGGSVPEKVALLIKGWEAYSEKGKVTPSNVKLDYVKDEDGFFKLNEEPTCGGIDGQDPIIPAVVVSERPEGYEPAVGDNTWVYDPDGNHWNGDIVSIDATNPNGATAMVKCAEGYGEESGQEFEIIYEQVRPNDPKEDDKAEAAA